MPLCGPAPGPRGGDVQLLTAAVTPRGLSVWGFSSEQNNPGISQEYNIKTFIRPWSNLGRLQSVSLLLYWWLMAEPL